MLEIIAVLVIGVAVGLAVLVLASVFLAYATQANYVDETYNDHDD